MKTQTTDFNNVLEPIVSEVKQLETVGIDIEGNINLKGTIIGVSADNLGANLLTSLGGHQSTYYCRICEKEKINCQTSTFEDISCYRTKEKYQIHLNTIKNSEKVDLKHTRGIVRYCVLNDLEHYNVFTNPTVDIMHDLNEGVVQLVLKQVFEHCIKTNVFKETELKTLIKFYSYAKIFRKDKPSEIVIKKKSNHLHQNSAQIKCLLLNLPFILYKYREHPELLKVWICVQSLIEIFQTVHSTKLKKSRVQNLKLLVHDFLTNFKNCFEKPLTPKMHYMTHYETIIRIMGPLINMSMMRSEAKHKAFKQLARDTNNFINIHKSLAIKHQEFMCNAMCKEKGFQDKISSTHLHKMDKEFLIQNSNNMLDIVIEHEINAVESMTFNSYRYDRESVVLYNSTFYKIFDIILYESGYYFLCTKLKNNGIDEFSKSVKVEYPQLQANFDLIKFDDIHHKNVYALKSINNSSFVIIDNINVIDELS